MCRKVVIATFLRDKPTDLVLLLKAKSVCGGVVFVIELWMRISGGDQPPEGSRLLPG